LLRLKATAVPVNARGAQRLRKTREGFAAIMLTAETRSARARLASRTAAAHRRPNDPKAHDAVVDARRDFRFTAANEYICRLVDSAPALTPDQLSRLSALLRPTSGAA